MDELDLTAGIVVVDEVDEGGDPLADGPSGFSGAAGVGDRPGGEERLAQQSLIGGYVRETPGQVETALGDLAKSTDP